MTWHQRGKESQRTCIIILLRGYHIQVRHVINPISFPPQKIKNPKPKLAHLTQLYFIIILGRYLVKLDTAIPPFRDLFI